MLNSKQQDYGFKDLFGVCSDDIIPHENLIRTAKNHNLKTEDLVQFALEVIQYEREHPVEEHTSNRALIILQARATDDVLNIVKQLCQSTNPIKRELGVRILREFSTSPFEKPFVTESLAILEELVKNETDQEVLEWAVSAIGYQGDPRAISLLLKFTEHPNPRVRFGVASLLVLNNLQNDFFTDEIANAYEKFIIDQDADIRWYAYANILEMFEGDLQISDIKQKERLKKILIKGLEDDDLQVREQAKKALAYFKV